MNLRLWAVIGVLFSTMGWALATPQTVTISGTNNTWDTKIDGFGFGVGLSYNYGGNNSMSGLYSGTRNGLIRFNLSGVLAGSPINSAILRIYRSSYSFGTAPLHVGVAQLVESWVEGTSGGGWENVNDGCTWHARTAGTLATPVLDSGEGVYYVTGVTGLADDPYTNASYPPPRKCVRGSDKNWDNVPDDVNFSNCASLVELKALGVAVKGYYYDSGLSKLWLRTSTGIRWYATNDLWTTFGGTVIGGTTNEITTPAGTGNGWYEWNVTSIVSNWITAGQSNYGFRLVSVSCELGLTASESNCVEIPQLVITCPVPAPAAENLVATNVTASGAWLNGTLVSTGLFQTTWGVIWGTNNPGATLGGWLEGGSAVMGVAAGENLTNSTQLTGLWGNQTYYYAYWATNAYGTNVATPMSFLTVPLTAPAVDNGAGAASVGLTNASLQGTVLAGNPAPNVWIYWGLTNGGTTAADWTRGALNLGVLPLGGFSSNVTGLAANQTNWYRCFASNSSGTAWADSSTNFVTAAPSLMITNIGVLEGALGATNTATFVVTLSATSAVPVSVNYATANGGATVADADYIAASGTLTIPAGAPTGAIPVLVVGNNRYETNESFVVNLTSPVNVTLGNSQGTCTITNDDFTLYVRGDGAGNNANGGGAWDEAFATLQKALDTVPYSTLTRINVQASTGSQAYAVCARTPPYDGTYPAWTLNFSMQGGWENVDGTPVQTGMSVVQDAATNQPGIKLSAGTHNQAKILSVNRFAFSNVSRGIEIIQNGNSCNISLTISNSTIRAKNQGLYLDGYHSYGAGYLVATVFARDVAIVAGLGGTGDGIYLKGAWAGSVIDATPGNVSSITSSNGGGVCFSACTFDASSMTCSNTIIYGCSSNGIHLDAMLPDYNGNSTSNRVRAVLTHCTLADNILDGLHMVSATAGSYGYVTNSIFSNNGGHGLNLIGTNGVFTCAEGYNDFYNDDLAVNGNTPGFSGTTLATDPQLVNNGSKPSAWYLVRASSSPASRSASDGLNRGAYLIDYTPAGSVYRIR